MKDTTALSSTPSENAQETANVSPEKPLLIFKATRHLPAEAYRSLQISIEEVAEKHGYGGILVDDNFDVQAVPSISSLTLAIEGQTMAMQAMADAIGDMVIAIAEDKAGDEEDERNLSYLDGTSMGAL